MYKLRFLLTVYARPLYKWLGAAAALSAVIAAGASFTAHFAPVMMVLGGVAAAITAVPVLLAILVLNAAAAASLQRGFDHFEAAYDAYRRANRLPDIFYEEADLAEAAERNGTAGTV
jgi:hypothetical protein